MSFLASLQSRYLRLAVLASALAASLVVAYGIGWAIGNTEVPDNLGLEWVGLDDRSAAQVFFEPAELLAKGIRPLKGTPPKKMKVLMDTSFPYYLVGLWGDAKSDFCLVQGCRFFPPSSGDLYEAFESRMTEDLKRAGYTLVPEPKQRCSQNLYLQFRSGDGRYLHLVYGMSNSIMTFFTLCYPNEKAPLEALDKAVNEVQWKAEAYRKARSKRAALPRVGPRA